MVYKRYIKKDGKTYGPYYYSSERKDGKVVSNYVKKSKKVDKKKVFVWVFAFLFLVVMGFAIFNLPSLILTGNVISDISFGDGSTSGTASQNWIYVNVSTTSSESDYYSFVDFASDVVLWLRMDDTNSSTGTLGALIYDNSSYGNNGTARGDAVQTAYGKWGKAYEFDGTGDYIRVSDDSSLDLQTNMTISAWVNGSSQASKSIVTKYTDSSNGAYSLKTTSGGTKSRFVIYQSGSQVFVEGNDVVLDNSWHNIVAVYNGSAISLYVDGVFDSSNATTGLIDTSSDNLIIGGGNDGAEDYFNGRIDDVLIFNRSLDLQEIKALYDASTNNYYHNFTGLNDSGVTYSYEAYSVDNDSVDSSSRSVTLESATEAEVSYNDTEYDVELTNETDVSNGGTVETGSEIIVKKESVPAIKLTTTGDVNLSELYVNISDVKIVVDKSSVTGIETNKSIYLNNTQGIGAIICPDATSIEEVNTSCPGKISFTYSQLESGTTKSGVYGILQGDGYYRFDNLSGSGGGEFSVSSSSVDNCANLNQHNTLYELSGNIENLTATGSCITISGNNVTLDCLNNFIRNGGVRSVYITGDNATVRNCNLSAGGTTSGSEAVYVDGGDNALIMDSILKDSFRAISISSGIGFNITRNTIYNNSNADVGLNDNGYFTYNNISDATSYGLYLSGSPNNVIKHNTINGGGASGQIAILSSSNNNTFENNTLIGCTGSLYCGYRIASSSNNTISGGNITNANGNYFYTSSTNNILVKDMELSGTSVFYFRLNGNDVNFSVLNVSYIPDDYVVSTSELFRKWYYQAYVNDTLGNSVSGVNVSIYNATDDLVFYQGTNSSGFTDYAHLTEYRRSDNSNTYYGNYSINVSKTGYSSDSKLYNVSLEENSVYDIFTLGSDTILSGPATLDSADTEYILTQDITGISGTCFNITAHNVTLDCNGFDVFGDGTGYGINATNSTGPGFNFTIRNCNISGFEVDVYGVGGDDDSSGSDTSGSASNIFNSSLGMINVTGGINAEGPKGGLIIANLSDISSIVSDGGMGSEAGDVSGGNGGEVYIYNSNIINISSKGRNENGFGSGGDGGDIFLENSSISNIFVYGGDEIDDCNMDGGGNGGNLIMINSSIINLYSYGGMGSTTGGNAGIVNSTNSNFLNIYSYSGAGEDPGWCGGGASGNAAIVNIQNKTVNLTNNLINISNNLGDISGQPGQLTINYTTGFEDTGATYAGDFKLKIVNASSGVIDYGSNNITGSSITSIADNVVIKDNFAEIDSATESELNQSADITLYNTPNADGARILRNGVECNAETTPACVNSTALNAETVEFNVEYWTNYTIDGEAGDEELPVIVVNNPTDGSEYDSRTMLFNITATDNVGVSSCVYNLGGDNITMSNSGDLWTNTNSSMQEGSYTATFYCNDTSSNWNSTSVSFTVDLTNISDCGFHMDEEDKVYYLTDDLEATETCLWVEAHNVTLEGQNNYVLSTNGVGYGINATNATGPGFNFSVNDINISGFEVDVYGVGGETSNSDKFVTGSMINIINSSIDIINVSGGEAFYMDKGSGGDLIINLSVIESIYAYGGGYSSSADGSGGSGGNINIHNSNITNINNYGADSMPDFGEYAGSGGDVVSYNSNILVINSYGGSSDADGGGSAGDVTITNSTILSINVSGGDALVTGGNAGDIYMEMKDINLSNINFDITYGLNLSSSYGGYPDEAFQNGQPGQLTINYTTGFEDTGATYAGDFKLKIVNASSGVIDYGSNNITGSSITSIADNVVIKDNFAEIDSATESELNQSADITLYNTPNADGARILRNGVECNAETTPACVNSTPLNAETVEFNVEYWTNYTIDGEAGDLVSPNVLVSLNDSILFNGSSVLVFWNASDDVLLDTVLFNITYPNGSVLYSSALESGNQDFDSEDLNLIGVYLVKLWANDSSGNSNYTSDSFEVTSDWPFVGMDEHASHFYNDNIDYDNLGVLWNYSLGFYSSSAGDHLLSSIVGYDKQIFVVTQNGTLFSVNSTDGTKLWNVDLGGEDSFGRVAPTYSNGALYLSNTTGTLFSVNASNGDILWTSNEGNYSDSSAIIVGGYLYISRGENQFYCFNANTGAKIWNSTLGGKGGTPVVEGSRVYVVADDERLYSFYKSNGVQDWNSSLAEGNIYYLPAKITYDSGRIFVPSGNYIYAFNSTNGTQIWRTSGLSYTYAAATDGVVVCFVGDGLAACYDVEDGSEVWSNFYTASEVFYGSGILTANDLFLVENDADNFKILNATNGSLIWNDTTSGLVLTSIIVMDGKIYASAQQMNESSVWNSYLVGYDEIVLQSDITPPIFTTIPANESIVYGVVWGGVDFDASDDNGVEAYFINDSDNFVINSTGYLDWTGQLAVGEYYVNVSVNDSSGNINSTIYNLNVTKATGVLSLTFDKESPQDYGTAITPTCSITSGEGTLELRLNDSIITSGEAQDLAAGSWNFSCSMDATQNYTSALNESNFAISKIAPTGSITGTTPITYGTTGDVEGVNCPAQLTCNLYRDDVLVSNPNTEVLSAGTYNYIFNTTGNENYTSASDSFELTINKVTPILNYYLNDVNDNISIVYPNTINASANTNAGTLAIYRNGTDITSDNNIDVQLGAGYYEYEFNVTGNENYTDVSSVYLYSEVNQDSSACDVLFNISSPQTWNTKFKVYTNCNSDFTLYRNGTEISNNSEQDLAVGSYNFTVIRTDSVNYSNTQDTEYFTIEQASNTATLTITPSTSETYGTETTASCSVDYGTAQLFRDGASVSNPETTTLAAGSYDYVCNVSGNENYTTASDSDTLVIGQETGVVYTYLDNSRDNTTILKNNTIWLNSSLNVGTGDVKLYINGTLNTTASEIGVYHNFTTAGLYNITSIYDGNTNYTSDVETWWVNVTDSDTTGPVVTLHSPEAGYSTTSTSINFQFNVSDSSDIANCTLYLDGTGYGNTSSISKSSTNTIARTGLSVASYTWYVNCTDVEGNEGKSSERSLTISAVADDPVTVSCFPAGTRILMSDSSYKLIEEVNVGDLVMSYDNGFVEGRVEELEAPIRDHICEIKLEDKDIKVTNEHPFYTKQGWKSINPEETEKENKELVVGKLEIGDEILNSNEEYELVLDINCWKEEIQTYNLKSISKYNNFFAENLLVHNKGPGCTDEEGCSSDNLDETRCLSDNTGFEKCIKSDCYIWKTTNCKEGFSCVNGTCIADEAEIIFRDNCILYFEQGWNFISICAKFQDYNFENVLSGLNDFGKIKAIYEWQDESEKSTPMFLGWNRDGTKQFTEFNPKKSYFILWEGESVELELTNELFEDMTLNIPRGWKLPTYPYEKSSEEIVNGKFYGLDYRVIYKWDPHLYGSGGFIGNNLYGSRQFVQIHPGQGLFIFGDRGEINYKAPER